MFEKGDEINAEGPGQNLLHYLTHLVQRKHEDDLLFMEDFKPCENVKHVTKEDIATELGNIQNDVPVTKKEVE